MLGGSLSLAEYPGATVRLSCDKCGRRGQYPKASLIARYGAEKPLPDLRVELAKCERQGKFHDVCAAQFPDLRPA